MIHHATLETSRDDVDDAVAFWALLGFERVEPPGRLGEIAVWVERAGTQVHFLFADDPIAPPRGHTAVVADDYHATIERLQRAGFQTRASTPDWGSPRSFVVSPGGHLVEVMAFPPGS